MKALIKGYIAGLLCGVCLCIFGYFFFLKDKPVSPEVIIKSDTLTVVRYDTVIQYKPKYISERVIDTVYVVSKDSSSFPLEVKQRYYAEENSYELWISGINPHLDKIKVFPKTVQRTITDIEIHKVYANSWRGYIGGSLSTFDGKWMPSLELTFTSPKTVYIKAGAGIFDQKPIYTFGAGIRIFGK